MVLCGVHMGEQTAASVNYERGKLLIIDSFPLLLYVHMIKLKKGYFLMTGNIVDLPSMLARREERSREQIAFLQAHHFPLISFSMNIPGPIKTNTYIRRAFDLGRNFLISQLERVNAEIMEALEIHQDTGDELLLSVANVQPEKLKAIAVEIEEASEIGRLYDIDVIDAQGRKLSRKRFRKCLICDKQAQDCARSRTHSVSDMQRAVDNILANFLEDK